MNFVLNIHPCSMDKEEKIIIKGVITANRMEIKKNITDGHEFTIIFTHNFSSLSLITSEKKYTYFV